MFNHKKIHISEIQSVIYVTPEKTDRKVIHYGTFLSRYELVYKISGRTLTHFNGKVIDFSTGTVELLPKCEKCDYYVEREEFGDCIDIYFDTDIPLSDEALSMHFSSHKIGALFDKIYRTWIAKKDGYYYKCMALFYEILAETEKPSGEYLPKEKYKKIEKGIDYLHEHCFDSKIDYYEPSHLCGISYTYFKQLFVKKFSVTPVQYVTRLRVQRAAELILTQRCSINEIATMCGFENAYYFSRVFKKEYGVSPKNYKQ